MTLLNQLMTCNLTPPVEGSGGVDYNEKLLSSLIEYNKKRYYSFVNKTDFVINKDFERLLNSRIQKVGRIKKRLLYLLIRYKYIWFCTFTFNNNYISKSERTKRDLIKKYLNTHDFKYILNIDYGKNTQRQHFHCILATNSNFDVNNYFQSSYPCHSLSILCKKGYEDLNRLTKYIDKLVNHCIKSTTNRQRLVYNFKGYNQFCPTQHDVTIQYKLELDLILKNVTLLDKGDITGKIKE